MRKRRRSTNSRVMLDVAVATTIPDAPYSKRENVESISPGWVRPDRDLQRRRRVGPCDPERRGPHASHSRDTERRFRLRTAWMRPVAATNCRVCTPETPGKGGPFGLHGLRTIPDAALRLSPRGSRSNSRLLGSQDDQWIDPRGTPRRNRAGDEHDDREERGDAAERKGIARAHFEQQRRQDTREYPRCR